MNTETERMICENCGCVIAEEKTENIENIIECSDGSVFCSKECANANEYYRCNCCGAYIKDAYHIEDTGEYICQECFNNGDYFQCDDCGDCLSMNVIGVHDDSSTYCAGCSDHYGYCSNCGKVIYIDNACFINDDSIFCSEECANANGYYRCDCCGEYVEDTYYIEDTEEIICQKCFFNRDYFQCDGCHKYFSNDSLEKYDDWNAYCTKCSEDYVHCEDCNELLHIDDAYEINGYYYCESCADNHRCGSDLHDYGYKPYPVFYGDTGEENQLFIGVELEVDDGNDANYLCSELEQFQEIYCKHDGSLGNEGVEIVSHPCTLKYHMESLKWNDIMNICLKNGYASHDAGTCGIHTHVNRTFFGDTENEQDLNIAKVVLLMNRFFESHIVPFSRRNYSQLSDWARKNNIQKIYNTDNEVIVSEKVKASKNSGRYQAVNLQNINTIEFRVFRGTLKYSTFIAILQFVDTICRFAKQINLNNIDNTKWEDIFIGTEWTELSSYLKERTDFDPDKVEKIMVEKKQRPQVKIGDTVVIRDWDDMVEEFGLDVHGNIQCNLYFAPSMNKFCGKTAKVSFVGFNDLSLEFDEPQLNRSGYFFSSDMINVIATRNDETEIDPLF